MSRCKRKVILLLSKLDSHQSGDSSLTLDTLSHMLERRLPKFKLLKKFPFFSIALFIYLFIYLLLCLLLTAFKCTNQNAKTTITYKKHIKMQ